MKKIFVTVAEFRRGGGSLVKGREIYFSDQSEAGLFENVLDRTNIIVRDFGVSFEMNEISAFVQIPCTPHYV